MTAKKKLCLVTGLSGAGKSTALHAFEDLGFFTIDGLPCSLAPDVAAMMEKPEMERFSGLAIGMDMRQADFPSWLKEALADFPACGMDLSLLFLDASDKELMRRYAMTRRPHPLEKENLGLNGAIARERAQLQSLRKVSDLVIDTSGYSIHDLRRAIHRSYSPQGLASTSLHVTVISFGYKYGIPADADFVFDLRFLDNPYFVPELSPLAGTAPEVAEYVFKSGSADKFLKLALQMLVYVFAEMETEGRSRVTLAMGCTGGRHRSVAMAEKIGSDLRQAGFQVLIEHRNIEDDRRINA